MKEEIQAILDNYVGHFRIKEGGKLSVNKAANDKAVQDIVDLFPIPDVSGQLLAFSEWLKKDTMTGLLGKPEYYVERFLKANNLR